jgi:hypothetical protein
VKSEGGRILIKGQKKWEEISRENFGIYSPPRLAAAPYQR